MALPVPDPSRRVFAAAHLQCRHLLLALARRLCEVEGSKNHIYGATDQEIAYYRKIAEPGVETDTHRLFDLANSPARQGRVRGRNRILHIPPGAGF